MYVYVLELQFHPIFLWSLNVAIKTSLQIEVGVKGWLFELFHSFNNSFFFLLNFLFIYAVL